MQIVVWGGDIAQNVEKIFPPNSQYQQIRQKLNRKGNQESLLLFVEFVRIFKLQKSMGGAKCWHKFSTNSTNSWKLETEKNIKKICCYLFNSLEFWNTKRCWGGELNVDTIYSPTRQKRKNLKLRKKSRKFVVICWIWWNLITLMGGGVSVNEIRWKCNICLCEDVNKDRKIEIGIKCRCACFKQLCNGLILLQILGEELSCVELSCG